MWGDSHITKKKNQFKIIAILSQLLPFTNILKNRWSVLERGEEGFSGGSVVKNPPSTQGAAGDAGLITGSGRSPGGGHATHSSVLAWRIPWTEEPGGLHSMGSQRVRHDWSGLACMHAWNGGLGECNMWTTTIFEDKAYFFFFFFKPLSL